MLLHDLSSGTDRADPRILLYRDRSAWKPDLGASRPVALVEHDIDGAMDRVNKMREHRHG